VAAAQPGKSYHLHTAHLACAAVVQAVAIGFNLSDNQGVGVDAYTCQPAGSSHIVGFQKPEAY